MKRSPWMNLPFWGLVGTLALLIVHLLLTNHGSSIPAIGFAVRCTSWPETGPQRCGTACGWPRRMRSS